MPMIKRALYLDKLDVWRDHDVIKVVSGVRRCGKSTLMELWKERLFASGVLESNVVHINLELLENEDLLEYHALHDEVLRRRSLHPGTTYVILDEIQNIPDFQKAVDAYTLGQTSTCISRAQTRNCCEAPWRPSSPDAMWKSRCCPSPLQNI